MYHSITFDNGVETKNTWDDWSLVPSSRPVFAPPEPKTKTIDIPGGDGVLDLTESLTGYPVYNNRTGSIEFAVINQWYQGSKLDNEAKWIDTYSEVMSFVHGRQLKAYLEDDPDHYYEGRFTVSDWQSGSYISAITIDYDIGPYRWNNSTNTFWSYTFTSSQTTVSTSFENFHSKYGIAPVCPEVTVTIAGTTLTVTNYETTSTSTKIGESATLSMTSAGTYQDPGIVCFGNVVRVSWVKPSSSSGTITVTGRGGSF